MRWQMQAVYDVLPNYLLILGFPWRTDIKRDIISVNLSFSNVRMSSGTKLFSHDFVAANVWHCLSQEFNLCKRSCRWNCSELHLYILWFSIHLYSSSNMVRVIKSRRMRWAGYVARMGERRGVYRLVVGKPEGKRPPGRPRCRWEDNI